jgi:hypothetical protein
MLVRRQNPIGRTATHRIASGPARGPLDMEQSANFMIDKWLPNRWFGLQLYVTTANGNVPLADTPCLRGLTDE